MARSSLYYMRTQNGDVFSTNRPEYHKDCEQLPKAEGERIYKAQVMVSLKKIIKPGSKVYTKLESVSSSGMSRRISVFVVNKGEIADITYSVAVVTGRKLSDKAGIVCNGCGMDMGFDLVYSLGWALWPNGTRKPHSMRNGQPDKHGGYALKHSWL